MRTVKEPEIRKQEILEGAIRIFANKGYENTSISDIAKELNISQGLCYRYYPSKEAIFYAALDEYAQYIVNRNIADYDFNTANLKEQIHKLSGHVVNYIKLEKEHPEFYQLFHNSESNSKHDQLFLCIAKKLIPFITKVLIQAKQKGEISVSNPEATAYFFVYGQMGLLMDKELDMNDKIKLIQDCLIELLNL